MDPRLPPGQCSGNRVRFVKSSRMSGPAAGKDGGRGNVSWGTPGRSVRSAGRDAGLGRRASESLMASPGGDSVGRRRTRVRSDVNKRGVRMGESVPTPTDLVKVVDGEVAPRPPASIRSVSAAMPPRVYNRRISRLAAVSIRRNNGGPSYAEILRSARERIDLRDIGITDPKIRWAVSGSLIIEVPGFEKSQKADLLAGKLKDVLGDAAYVSRPVAKGELRIWGLDDSITVDELVRVVASCGDCAYDDIRCSSITKMLDGLGAVWIQCPLGAAVKVAAAGRVRVGWSSARVENLQARPIQCYRCWQYGHTSNKCRAAVDRSRLCCRCGQGGHMAKGCASPCCFVCDSAGMPSGHRMGTKVCGSAAAALQPGRRSNYTCGGSGGSVRVVECPAFAM